MVPACAPCSTSYAFSLSFTGVWEVFIIRDFGIYKKRHIFQEFAPQVLLDQPYSYFANAASINLSKMF